MLKKLLSVTMLISLSQAAVADPILGFDFSQGTPQYFYCQATSAVTTVSFEDHSVLVSGFDSNGLLSVSGTTLNQVYFTALPDPNKKNGAIVAWSSQGDEKGVECFYGTGGRLIPYGFGR